MTILEIYGRGKVIDEFKNDSALKKSMGSDTEL